MDRRVRILLADHQALVRDGLRKLLEGERELLVIGEAADGEEASRAAVQLKPDIVLLEWSLPDLAGNVVLRELRDSGSPTRVIVVTAAIDPEDVQRVIALGARGLVLKTSGSRVLVQAIRAVIQGQYWFDREALAQQVQALRRSSEEPVSKRPGNYGLTARELDIVSAVAAAYPNKAIAQRYSISQKTVKHHLSNIFDKVGVSNRVELVLFALNHKLQLADLTTEA